MKPVRRHGYSGAESFVFVPESEKEIDARFWEKVDQSGDCWVWIGSRNNGYGQFRVDGKLMRAHRFAYERVHGKIRAGLYLHHLCENPPCVKPDHLSEIKPADHIEIHVDRTPPTHCKHGHKLSGENVRIQANGWRACRACARRNSREYAIRDGRSLGRGLNWRKGIMGQWKSLGGTR